MCHISAVPSPSRSSTPKTSFQRRWRSTGSASPAEVARRREERSRSGASGWASMRPIIVGTFTRGPVRLDALEQRPCTGNGGGAHGERGDSSPSPK